MAVRMDMTPGSKHNDEHDEAQKKVFRGYGFRPGGKNNIRISGFWVTCLRALFLGVRGVGPGVAGPKT